MYQWVLMALAPKSLVVVRFLAQIPQEIEEILPQQNHFEVSDLDEVRMMLLERDPLVTDVREGASSVTGPRRVTMHLWIVVVALVHFDRGATIVAAMGFMASVVVVGFFGDRFPIYLTSFLLVVWYCQVIDYINCSF